MYITPTSAMEIKKSMIPMVQEKVKGRASTNCLGFRVQRKGQRISEMMPAMV